MLLREANRRTGLIDALAGCIADPRDPAKTRHEVKTMLTQRVCGIALGYEDGNDHQALREDPIMQILSEIAPDPNDPLASPATLSRFENWVNRKSLARMSGVFVDPFIASHAKPPKEITLDFDATKPAAVRIRPVHNSKLWCGGKGVCAPTFSDRNDPRSNAPQIKLDTNSQSLMKYAG